MVVSALSLFGVVTLWLNAKQLKRILLPLVSLAVGGLFGDAFIHLIPESYGVSKDPTGTGLLVLLGIVIFLVLEKSLHFYHHHDHGKEDIHSFGYLNLLAGGLHNFIDGLLIGVSYLAGFEVGLATTLAVILHEIPHEIGDFSVLVHAGFKPSRALLYNFLTALLAFGGAILSLTLAFDPHTLTSVILPITAGGFIYIAGSDLIPEIHKELKLSGSLLQVLAMAVGSGLMLLVKLLE
jgi:zinc and cadmium transporter